MKFHLVYLVKYYSALKCNKKKKQDILTKPVRGGRRFLIFGFQMQFLKQNVFDKTESEMVFKSIISLNTFTLIFKIKKNIL